MEDSPGRRCTCSGDGEDGGVNNMAVVSPLPPHMLAGLAPADKALDAPLMQTRIPNMPPKTLPMSKEDEYDRVHQRLAAIRTTTGEMKKSQTVQMEYCVSPRSPLLVTAIEENGWSCGDNSSGQLGTGGPFECVPARTITEVKRWAAVSLGPRHGAGLDSSGKLYTWGLSDQGQLGLGATAQALAPTPVEDVPEMDPESDAFRGVACGAEHTVAVTTRHVLAWGSDRHGQLGLNSVGSSEPVPRPRIVMDLVGLMVTQVVCGSYHTMCATAQSVVYSWGCNTHGQLGLEDCQDRHAPVVVDALWALPVKQLAAGETHSAALTTNGALFTWGCNRHGQLGQPPDAERAAEVRRRNGSLRSRFRKRINQKHLNQMLEMGIEKEMAELALHETNNCGVDVAIEWLFSAAPDHINAKMAEWVESPDHPGPSAGANGAVVPTPRRVPLKGVRYVAAGLNHTVAVTDDGLYSWGANESGQLGLGNTADAELPAPVAALSELKVGRVACGSRHTLFLTDDGQVLGCGCTGSGQLSTLDAASLARDVDASGRVASGGRERLPSQRSRLGLSGPSAAAAGPGVGSSSSAAPWDDMETEQQPQPREGSEASLAGLVEGQLVITPLPVQLPFMVGGGSGRASSIGGSFRSPAGSEPVVCDVQAGGDGSMFLVRGRDDEVGLEQLDLWERLQDTVSEVEQRVAEGMMDMAKAHSLVKRLEQAIEMIFGKAAALSAAFGYHSKVGLDYLLVEETHLRILNLLPLTASMTKLFQQQVETALFKATGNLVDELASHSKLLNTAERAQLLMVVAQNPLLADHKRATQLLPKICETILTAPSAARHLLTKWWSDCPKDLLELRVVRPIQSFLTTELNTTKKLTTPVMNAIKVLSKVEESNQISQKLPPEVMYNQLISEKMDVLDHYVAWRQTQDVPEKRGSNGPFSFCSYPFLLDAKAKSKLLQTEARIQMEQTIAQARMESLYKHSAKRGAVEAVQYVLPRKKQGAGSGPTRSSLGFARRAARMAASVGSSGAGSSAGAGAGSSGSSSRGDSQRQPGLGRLIFGRLFNGARAGRDADAGDRPRCSSSSSSSHGFGSARSRRDMRDAEDEEDKPGRGSGDSTARSSQLGSEERRLMALDVSASQLLPRQNSMHLPPPDRCNTPATHSDHCILRIRRTHLLLDAMDEVARQKTKDLFKPLRVVFIGEDGIDAGGVRKEFFALLLQELLSPEYGLFLYQPESRTYWINPLNLDMDDDWTLMGLVVGLAVYNGVLLDLPLPVTFYKKMLGLKCNLRDLEEMQPDIGKSLRQLLTYEGPGLVEDIFAQTFSIEQHVLGQVLTLELVPGGDSISVTEENRAEFVELYVEQVLVKGVARQFEAFKRGFMLLFEGPAIGLFNAQELERLVCGNPNLNFEALITHARYEGGFTAESMAVQWLWKTVRDFGMEEKKMFLKFFTGSDRAPIGGLGNLRCLIQRDGPDSHKLPTSHTCFNTLLLPDYSSLERLRDRLQLAIMNSEGFGLE